MPDTAIAIALTEAGYRDPLNALAHEAWRKWSSADAGGARRDFVKARLCRELTWTLIEQWQPQALTQAVGWLLNRAKDDTEHGLNVAALRQTATELLRLYADLRQGETFEPLGDDAVQAWGRIAAGMETLNDLDLIRMRRAAT